MSKMTFKYKNYAFDLYGTLVDIITDEESFSFWKKVAKKLDIDPSELRTMYKEECRKMADGCGFFEEFDLLEIFKIITQKYNSSISPEDFACSFRLASIKYERLFPKVKKNLKALKNAGKGVYLISNAQSCFTMKELEKLDILRYFDGIAISSDIGYKKPSKEIFEIAFRKFGIKREDTLFVGNDLNDDILGAKNFGVDYFYIETKQSGYYPELEYLKPNK